MLYIPAKPCQMSKMYKQQIKDTVKKYNFSHIYPTVLLKHI